jgi:hypothetical protein
LHCVIVGMAPRAFPFQFEELHFCHRSSCDFLMT